ncbi:ATP-binding protein, partial [Arthrospira platensis SPKY2]
MKIRYEERENISNSSQNSRKFKLSEDPSATLNIIQILTENLYTNPKRSAIRETLANAIDASVEKNNKLNIKTPPRIDVYITNDEINNSFLYFLNIKDYGIGINEERMENYLSKIGNSSKRDSDEQIGALGIGVCTLFCIGEQVFIESYITDDNNRTEKIKYLLYKDKVGIPCYDLKEKEYIEEKREESYTIIKILLEGEDILNTVIKYILENCCLIDIDLYTNIKSLVLLSSYIKKYKKKNNNFRFLKSYYLIKKDKDFIEKKEISSNNNNYYNNNYCY